MDNEINTMSDPYSVDMRIENWKEVLSQLVLLKEIDLYFISPLGDRIMVECPTGFRFYFNYYDDIISNTIREIRLDQLLNPE